MTLWFTSDLHIGHANIIDYCNRPFRDAGGNPDVPFMNEMLVKNWNERVIPDDLVVCLGDMVMGRRDDGHEEDRYSEHRPTDDGTPLLHGHVHDVWKVRRSKKGTLMINVGVDAWDYAPVSGTEIVALLHGDGR